MNHTQCLAMADHLTKDFRGYGPGKPTWMRVLDQLDFDRSFVAYMNLLGTCPERPSVAEFMRSYQETAPAAPAAPKVACKVCAGEGWRTVPFQSLGRTYDGVVPCECPAGRRHDATHKAIVRFNQSQPWHSPDDTVTAPALEGEAHE